MTTATTPAPTGARYQVIPLKQLRESPSNPRKSFGDMAEFTKNVTHHGILEPIIVRAIAGDAFEIVCGHRRYRAAKAAGFPEIPSIIRELGDGQVLEMQIVENCQRADIHPMEEAEAYETLHSKHKVPIDDIAAKVGKSKAFVYARMKLLALVPLARKAFYEEKLSASTAILIARIANKDLQEKALKEATKLDYNGELPSVRDVQDLLERRFMLRLAGAPFQTDDATLLPSAGPCTTCPKRTGNQKELFADVKSPDTCTDPPCFEAKKKAATARVLEQAKAKGQEVLATNKAFDYGDRAAKGWIDLDKEVDPYGGESRKWKTILGKHAPDAVVAVDPEGRAHHLVRETEARKVLREQKIKIKERPSYSSRPKESANGKAERAKRELRAKVIPKFHALLIEKAKAKKIDAGLWRMIGAIALDSTYGEDLPKRWGQVSFKPLRNQLAKMDDGKARALFLDAYLSNFDDDTYHDYADEMKAAADYYDIDLKKLEREISAPPASVKPNVPVKIVVKKSSKKKPARKK